MSCLGRTCTLGAVFVSLAFSLGCGGSPCPAGSVAMDGRCISIDAGVDSGPDAQAEAGFDAGDAASDSAITDGGVVDTGTDDGGADAGDGTNDGGADARDSGAVDSGAVDSGPVCDGGLVGCGGACIDTTADPMHCGACGVVCGASETCCGGACVDTSSDAAHCGSCVGSCAGSETCCAGGCSDLSTDTSHCGSCGTNCGASEVCAPMDPRAAGPVCECNVGLGCSRTADCSVGLSCVPEIDASSHPNPLGGGGFTDAIFSGGICTTGVPLPGASACDPVADDCGACSSCQQMNESNPPAYACLEDCSVNTVDNGGCRPGYQCDPSTASCRDGCTSDSQCNRVRLSDGRVTTIAGGTGSCNLATARCGHPGAASSHTGDACANDFACPADQQCLFALTARRWPGGYCTRAECDASVSGFACPADSVCSARHPAKELDRARCLRPCTFLAEITDGALRIGPSGHGVECRTGYACVWDGVSVVGAPNSGTCQPGNYNGVATSNVGMSCTSDNQCYSPFGAGRCFGEPGQPRFCTQLDCTIGLTVGLACGGTSCAPISPDGSIEGCVQQCVTANDCNPGQGCVVGGGARICLNFCRSALDCRSGQTCSIPAGEATGRCI